VTAGEGRLTAAKAGEAGPVATDRRLPERLEIAVDPPTNTAPVPPGVTTAAMLPLIWPPMLSGPVQVPPTVLLPERLEVVACASDEDLAQPRGYMTVVGEPWMVPTKGGEVPGAAPGADCVQVWQITARSTSEGGDYTTGGDECRW